MYRGDVSSAVVVRILFADGDACMRDLRSVFFFLPTDALNLLRERTTDCRNGRDLCCASENGSRRRSKAK